MRYAVINNGVVENVIEAEQGFTLDGHILMASDNADIGWTYDGTTLVAPVEAPRVIPVARLSKRIVVERLNKAGLLTAAFQAIGGPGAFTYERWSASAEVDPSDPDVNAVLTSIGADKTVILRPGIEV